jgi:TRAP-type mannitol/chloroaromatic compound transport system substrate-binding protein
MADTLKRRALLGGAAVAAAAPLATPALAQGAPRKLSLVTSWPRNSPIIPASAERIARTITQLTNGQIEFEIFHSGEKVKPFEVQDAVGAGEADCYHSVEQYFNKKHPAFVFFSAVPFGLVAHEMSGWLKYGGGQAFWDELAGAFGVRAFMAGSPGAQMGGWFPRPINTTEDLKGIKFRIPGAAGKVYAAAGVDTISLPGSQLVEALFSDQIQAVEWIGPYLDLDYGFVKLLPHYMYPGWHDPGGIRSFGVNAALFEQLSPTEQSIIELAAARENTLLEAELNKLNGESVFSMKREYGAQVHKFPDDFLKELFRLSTETMDEIATHDDLAKRTHQSYFEYRDAVAEYAAVSSSAYLEARNTALALNKVSRYDD